MIISSPSDTYERRWEDGNLIREDLASSELELPSEDVPSCSIRSLGNFTAFDAWKEANRISGPDLEQVKDLLLSDVRRDRFGSRGCEHSVDAGARSLV